MHKNLGINMLEVMVSLFIFSGILLCWNGLQVTTARINNASLYYNLVLNQIDSLTELDTILLNNFELENYLANIQEQISIPNFRINYNETYPHHTLTFKWNRGDCNNEWVKTCIAINLDLA